MDCAQESVSLFTMVRRPLGIIVTAEQKSTIDLLEQGLDTRTTVRLALEKVAQALETKHGNHLYMAAWKTAAKFIRSYKPD